MTAASAGAGGNPKRGGGKPTGSFKPGRVTVNVNPPDVIPPNVTHPPSSSPDQKKDTAQPRKNKLLAAVKGIPIPSMSLSSKKGKDETAEDERQSTRWGVPPVKLPSNNPILAVTDSVSGSIKSVGRGVTGVKDALYDATETAGSLVELTQQSIDSMTGKNVKQVEEGAGVGIDGSSKQQSSMMTPLSSPGAMSSAGSGGGGNEVGGSGSGGVDGAISVLKALGAGAIVVKDAFWGSIDVLSETAEAAKNAPQVAKSLTEESKAALEGAKENIQAVVRAPAAAADAVSKTVNGAGRAAASVKDGAYGAIDAVAQLASVPAEIAERRQLEQEARQQRALEKAKARREKSRQIESTITSAKAAVWGTVEGVETLVTTVASTPAAVESGIGLTQEALKSAGDVVESIPRTIQEIPLEAQRQVDEVTASVASTQERVNSALSAAKGNFDSAAQLAKRASDIITGREKAEREERERIAREEARAKKMREAIVVIAGEPITSKDLAVGAGNVLKETAKGAVGLGKNAVTLAWEAKDAPAKITRNVLSPFYNYQQSRRRIREALAKQGSLSSPPSTTPSSPSASADAAATGLLESSTSSAFSAADENSSSTDTIAAGDGADGSSVPAGKSDSEASLPGGGGTAANAMDGEGVLGALTAEGVSSAAEEPERPPEKKKWASPPSKEFSGRGKWSKKGAEN